MWAPWPCPYMSHRFALFYSFAPESRIMAKNKAPTWLYVLNKYFLRNERKEDKWPNNISVNTGLFQSSAKGEQMQEYDVCSSLPRSMACLGCCSQNSVSSFSDPQGSHLWFLRPHQQVSIFRSVLLVAAGISHPPWEIRVPHIGACWWSAWQRNSLWSPLY